MKTTKFLHHKIAIVLLALGLSTCDGWSQIWTNLAGGNWGTAAYWVTSVPNSTGALANFATLNFTNPITVTVDGDYTVGRMIFANQNTNPGGSWNITSSSLANFLTLATNTGIPIITVSNLGVGQKASISAELTGTNGVAINGPGNLLLSGPNIYSSNTIVSNSATLTIGAANTLPVTTILALGDTNSGTVGNLSLAYNQTLSGLYSQSVPYTTNAVIGTNIITIPTNLTLTVNGNVIFGSNFLAKHIATDLVTVTGGGTFMASTNGGNFRVGATDQTSSAAATSTIADFSGLNALNISLATNTLTASNGTVFVGDFAANVGSNVSSVFILASNSTINASSLQIGVGGRLNTESVLLGSGSNIFNISSNLLGVNRDEGQMYFYTNTGTLTMRAADGISRSYIGLGYNIAGANGASNQFVDFGTHYVDLYLTAVVDGYDRRAGFCSNYFGFSKGILDTTSLQVGDRSGTPTAGASLWVAVCTLGGGTVLIGTNGIVMGTSAGTTSSTLATNMATLNITGGSVTVSNEIVLLTQKATTGNEQAISTLNITGGTNTFYGDIYCLATVTNPGPRLATLTLNGGILDMTGHAIGGEGDISNNPTNYVDVINILSGTLLDVGQINGGVTSLVKSGAGLLTLGGSNTYSSGTIAASGTLLVTNDGALGTGNLTVDAGVTVQLTGGISNSYVYAGADLIFVSGAGPINLNYTGNPDHIAGLSFDGGATFQATGTWGSSASGATHQDNTHFSGTGTLLVTTAPTVILTSSPNPVSFGQSVIFTATVSGGLGTPTGSVSFYSGGILMGTSTLNSSGVATFTNSALNAGTNSITAIYSGDNVYSAVTSAPSLQVVSVTPIALYGTNLVLQYGPSLVGTNYVLVSTTNLVPPIVWTPIATNVGTGGTISVTIPFTNTVPAEFFTFLTQ